MDSHEVTEDEPNGTDNLSGQTSNENKGKGVDDDVSVKASIIDDNNDEGQAMEVTEKVIEIS